MPIWFIVVGLSTQRQGGQQRRWSDESRAFDLAWWPPENRTYATSFEDERTFISFFGATRRTIVDVNRHCLWSFMVKFRVKNVRIFRLHKLIQITNSQSFITCISLVHIKCWVNIYEYQILLNFVAITSISSICQNLILIFAKSIDGCLMDFRR